MKVRRRNREGRVDEIVGEGEGEEKVMYVKRWKKKVICVSYRRKNRKVYYPSEIPPDYVRRCVESLQKFGADYFGGQCSIDTITFGVYRHEVFERIGGFDEELGRNQDDEFNFHLLQAGGKIWLDPSLKVRYYSLSSWRQYFENRLYKVRLIQKRGRYVAMLPFPLIPFATLHSAYELGFLRGLWRWRDAWARKGYPTKEQSFGE